MNEEHKEFGKDLAKLLFGLFQISTVINIVKFIDKWFLKKIFAQPAKPGGGDKKL